MRCEHCGREQANAEYVGSTHCNPPFTVQPHAFNGKHPADVHALKVSKNQGFGKLGDTVQTGLGALGAVRIDPNSDAARARIVRQALLATEDYHLSIAARSAPDAALRRLGRLLK